MPLGVASSTIPVDELENAVKRAVKQNARERRHSFIDVECSRTGPEQGIDD